MKKVVKKESILEKGKTEIKGFFSMEVTKTYVMWKELLKAAGEAIALNAIIYIIFRFFTKDTIYILNLLLEVLNHEDANFWIFNLSIIALPLLIIGFLLFKIGYVMVETENEKRKNKKKTK